MQGAKINEEESASMMEIDSQCARNESSSQRKEQYKVFKEISRGTMSTVYYC